MKQLDSGTRAYDSTGSGDVQRTWAGLISSVMVCVTSELEDEKRVVDKNATSLLRKLVTAAEGRKKTNGLSAPLIRRAGKIFTHVLYVLQTGDVNFVVDYVHVLRTNLLVAPEYCSRAKQSVFEGLIEYFASNLASYRGEVINGEKKEERYRGAAAFNLLLRNCPFDLSTNAVNGLFEVFKEIFRDMHEDGRTPAMLVSAMNSFLLKTSLDVSSRMTSLHESVVPYLSWALKGNARDKRLKEELIKYCHLHVNLDVVSDGGAEFLVELLARQIDEIGSDRSVGGDNAERFEVKLPQKLLFELFADLVMVLKQQKSFAGVCLYDGERTPKRARGNEKPVERILSKILNDSGCWSAVFCLLLKRHSAALTKEELASCAKRLLHALSEMFSQGSMSDMKALAHAIWLIRCLQEIAGTMHNETLPLWTDVTNCLVYWLPAHLSDVRLTNDVLLLFAAMISHRLVHPSLLRQKFWLLTIFDFADIPSLATLELVGAVASIGLCDHVLAGRSYDSYFKWLIRGLSQKNDDRMSFYGRRANVTSSYDLALLRVQSAIQNSFIAGSHKPWVDDVTRRAWLEVPDEEHLEFLRGVEDLHLVAKPFATLKLEFRDAAERKEDDGAKRINTKELSMDPEVHRVGTDCLEHAMTNASTSEDAMRLCTIALGIIGAVASVGRSSRSVQSLDWGVSGSLIRTVKHTISTALEYDTMVMLNAKTSVLETIPILAGALEQIQQAAGLGASLEATSHKLVKVLTEMTKDFLKIIRDALQGNGSVPASARQSQEAVQFGDDLDFEMADATLSETQRSNTSQMATTSGSNERETTIACGEQVIRKILRCFKSMSVVVPSTVTTSTSMLLRYAVPPEGAPPRGPCGIGVSQDIAELVVDFVGLADTEYLIDHLVPCLQAVARGQVNLDENTGLTSSARLWLLHQITVLCHGICRLKLNASNYPSTTQGTMPSNIHEVLADLVSRAAGILDGEAPAALRNCVARAKLADCIFSLFKLNIDYFQPRFGSSLAWLLGDESYLVRIHAGSAIASILDFYEEADHTSIFQNTVVPGLAIKCQFLPNGSLNIGDGEIAETEAEWSSLHFISAVGVVSRVLEPWCTYIIVHHRARHGERVQIPAINALKYLAEATGHTSLESFVAYHSRTIGKLWIDSGAPLSMLFQVPEFLGLSQSAERESVAIHLKRSLLPALIYEQDRDGLKTLTSTCGMAHKFKQMIQGDWDAIYARLYASAVKSNPDRKAIQALTYANSMVKNNGGWNSKHPSVQIQILFELLLLARDPVSPPYSRSSDIVEVVGKFMDEKDLNIRWDVNIIFQCMLRIHEAVDMATSSRHKLKTLNALKVLLLCIGDERVRSPSIFRYVYFMLIPNINDHTIGTQCIQVLVNLTLNAYDDLRQADDAESELALAMESFIMPLMFVLSSVVESKSSPNAQRNEALKLLTAIVTNPPMLIHHALCVLPPLPDVPMLSEVRSILSVAFEKPSFDIRLMSLVKKAPTLPKALSRVALRAGGLEALQHKTELAQMYGQNESSSIPENVWKFAELVSPLGDTELFAIAAELLSLLGPLRPNTLAFITPEMKLPIDSKHIKVGLTEAGTFVFDVLKYLSGLLCSPMSSTVRAAATTIQSLLMVKKAALVMDKMSKIDKAYLLPFEHPSLRLVPESVSATNNVTDAYALDDERLWTVNENGSETKYEEWICRLSHRLISEFKPHTKSKNDPQFSLTVFELLGPLMISDAVLAELVFPPILYEITSARGNLSIPANREVRDRLSRGVSICLSRANLPEGKKAAKFMLRALDYLRGKRMRAFRMVDALPQDDSKVSAVQRKVPRGVEATQWEKVYWLNVDYLVVAQAAIRLQAPLTATLLVEHWLEDKTGTVSLNAMDSQGQTSDAVPPYLTLLLEAQSKLSEPDGLYGLLRSNSLELQLHLSEHEGHWDRALAGYDLLQSDVENNMNGGMASSRVPMLNALRQLGCLHLLRAYSKALSDDELAAPELKDVQYEAAWRAGQWTLPAAVTRTQNSGVVDFNQNLHSSLRALERGDVGCAIYETNRCRAQLLQNVISGAAESADAMNITIMRMRMLDDVTDAAKLWRHFMGNNIDAMQTATKSLSDSWQMRHVKDGPFKLIEPSLALQGVLLRLAGLSENFAQHTTRTSILARKAGHITEGVQAIRALRIMASRLSSISPGKPLPDLILSRTAPWRVEEAKLLWAEGKAESSIAIVNSIVQLMLPGQASYVTNSKTGTPTEEVGVTEPEANPDARFFELLCLLSKWQASARTESSKVILRRLLDGVNGLTMAYRKGLLDKTGKKITRGSRGQNVVVYTKDGINPVTQLRLLSRAHFRLAQFTDSQYRQLEERMNSPEWIRSEALRQRNENELTHLKSEREVNRNALRSKKKGSAAYNELAKAIHSMNARCGPLEMQVLNDQNETVSMYNEHTSSLISALQAYRRSLEAGGWNSQKSIFRMIALWFTHCGGGSNRSRSKMETLKVIKAVNAELEKLINRPTIPSYVFVELSHQIVSRLGSPCAPENDFIKVLEQLVLRIMRDHPYHVLYQIQALTRGDRVARAGVCATNEKIVAAKRLLETYSSESNDRKLMLSQMERLIEAYIHIAQLKLPQDESLVFHPLPNDVKKRALCNLKMIPVPTAPMAVDPACKYPDGSFPYFLHFADSTRLVGGINEPKLLGCHGSDGQLYRQLAKSGNDDLRQDAVIQQFFGLVNTLLKQNTSTNSRSMRIRTYKVIPFSPEAGLLEWVDETVLLSNYLIRDKKGAHERYRPHDMKSRDISQMMRDAVTAEAQHKMYEEVCENFKPVMHNFFLEHYPDPSNWFERRVAYSRSCAVNSIVGYVIGLGDRHSSNIMIDKWTAEFIHIDFGVTFEQGLTLKTPERVPFRLTRDIVDGMGACGVEGIMRRCCEETMKVLRSNRDALTTIIAVLVHDPILKWAVGGRRQNANIFRTTTMFGTKYPIAYALNPDREVVPSDEGNLDAERALMRVKQKLDGYEDGELRSIEGQVQQLLHDARDPHKLAVMYAGWAPWV